MKNKEAKGEEKMGNYEFEAGMARAIFETPEKGGILLRIPKEDAEKVKRIMGLQASDRCTLAITPREIVVRRVDAV